MNQIPLQIKNGIYFQIYSSPQEEFGRMPRCLANKIHMKVLTLPLSIIEVDRFETNKLNLLCINQSDQVKKSIFWCLSQYVHWDQNIFTNFANMKNAIVNEYYKLILSISKYPIFTFFRDLSFYSTHAMKNTEK